MEYKIKRSDLFKLIRLSTFGSKIKDVAFYKLTCRDTMLNEPITFSEQELGIIYEAEDNLKFKKELLMAFPKYNNLKFK